MIARRDLFEPGPAPVLRVGDEPHDLARGRLLFEMEGAMNGRPPEVVLPGKGDVPPPTSLDGEDGEWLIRHARGRIPAEWDWLRALVSGDDGPRPVSPSRAALREIEVLLAAARRSAAHDLDYAFELLAEPPERVRHDARLRAFREEVNRAVGPALRVRPRFAWRVALVPFLSAESVEDIVAARWRDQLSRYVVLAANSGYVAGRISFAFRAPEGLDGAGVVRSALPDPNAPFRADSTGAAGRGILARDGFQAMLERLRFRRPAGMLP